MTGSKRDASKGEKAKAVASILAESEGPRVDAVLFFDDSVPASDLEERINDLIVQAEEAGSRSEAPAQIGQISSFAKSVALEVDRGVFEEICRSADVKTVLPSKVRDIYPKPVGESGGGGRSQRGTRGKKSGL